jgi:light-harvesting complex 1 beta chain
MTMACSDDGVTRPLPTQDTATTRTIFICGYVLFFAIALVAGALGAHWRTWLPGAEGVKSLNGGVKAAVYSFMSLIH